MPALKSGLVISYSVNEQVAGQFQVLLASSVAKRIGLHGPPAIGLAPGSAPSIVIGKAILITTKGGRNTVKIQFGKKTAAKLRAKPGRERWFVGGLISLPAVELGAV